MMELHKQRTHCGFTLIELLVVIAIVAIMAAILFPLYSSAKVTAKQATCLNNLTQLGRAIRLYADDNDGRVPPVRNDCGESIPGSYQNWAGSTGVGDECRPEKGLLFPWVKNKGVYVCPSDRGKIAPHIKNPKYKSNYPLSYTMNFLMSWRRLDTLTRKPWTGDYGFSSGTGANGRPSRVMLLIHEDRNAIDDGDFNFFPSYDAPDRSHHDGTNVLYCDLHVRWSLYDDLERARARQEWHPDRPCP